MRRAGRGVRYGVRGNTISNASFTGVADASGTSRTVGFRKDLAGSAIPFIALSSGSVAANGAISGITALPRAYPAAYCYFPANILATSIAAGWHYCTFSTTTAGTAFLNTYTSGIPTIPASPTAVTDGKGAFTGVITEISAQITTVPANSLGTNGDLQLQQVAQNTNNANVKTFRIRFSGAAGTIIATQLGTSFGLSIGLIHQITNAGSAAVQSTGTVAVAGVANATNGPLGLTVDTTAATTIHRTMQKATATDNMVIEQYADESVYRA